MPSSSTPSHRSASSCQEATTTSACMSRLAYPTRCGTLHRHMHDALSAGKPVLKAEHTMQEEVDLEECRKVFPYGQSTFEVGHACGLLSWPIFPLTCNCSAPGLARCKQCWIQACATACLSADCEEP
jgi:hypothetical protein